MTWQKVAMWRENVRFEAALDARSVYLRHGAGRELQRDTLRFWGLNRADIRRLMKTYDVAFRQELRQIS